MTKPNNDAGGFALPQNLAIWLVAAAAGLLVIILLVVAVTRPSHPPAVAFAAPSAALATPVLDNSEAERRALVKAQLQRLKHEGDDICRILDECEQEFAAWDRDVQLELTGKRGQAVAADRESLQRFSAVYAEPPTTRSELVASRERVSTLLEPVVAALASETLYAPSGDVANQLAPERKFAQQSRQALQERRQNALSVLAEAERKGASGNRTLKEAMTELEDHHAKARVDEVTVRQEMARRESTERIAEARAEQERSFGREEAERIKNETNREIERRRAEDVLKSQQAAHDTLKARASNPAVQARYTPFLGKGKFGSPNNVPGLLSFNYLNEIGALESVENFVNAGSGRKIVIGSGVNPAFAWNDRKHWDYPAKEQEWQEFTRRYDEFRELAPFWIELQLLRE